MLYLSIASNGYIDPINKKLRGLPEFYSTKFARQVVFVILSNLFRTT